MSVHQAAGINLAGEPERIAQVFGYGPTIDGYEVIDLATGRPVSAVVETAQIANGKAQHLNAVAASGNIRALAKALRAG